MSQYYVPEEFEKHIRWHIPFTPYFLYCDQITKLWHIVEKEFFAHGEIGKEYKPYWYRFL